MNIEMLSEDKKNLAIQEIIEKGILSPRDRFRKLTAAFRFCLPRYLFFDMGDCIFIGLLAAFIGWVLLWRVNDNFLCCSLLVASPFAYMAIYLLTTWKEYQQQMYEMKMVCFFDLYQVTALRMLYFSSLNIVLNFIILFSERSFFHSDTGTGTKIVHFTAFPLDYCKQHCFYILERTHREIHYGIVCLYCVHRNRSIAAAVSCSIIRLYDSW